MVSVNGSYAIGEMADLFKEIFREFSLTCMGDESDFFDNLNYYMY